MKSTLYIREKGPICYEAELFEYGNESELDTLIKAFLSSDLRWYWASDRQFEETEEYKEWNLPKVRYFSELTNKTANLLYQDFLEEDTDLRRRTIELYGLEGGQIVSSKGHLKHEMTEFLVDRNSILHGVVIQINDTETQYTFVPQTPSKEMQELLDKWALKKESAQNVRKYQHLHLAQLENMADGLIDGAFDNSES